MFYCYPDPQDVMMYRLSPNIKTQDAITQLLLFLINTILLILILTHLLMTDYAAKFKLEVLIGKLAGLFAALSHFYFMSWFIWFGSIYSRTTHKRNWYTQSIRRICISRYGYCFQKILLCLVLISCVDCITCCILFFAQLVTEI